MVRHLWKAWMLLLVAWLAIAAFPINTWYIRIATVTFPPVLAIAFALLQKKRRWWRWVPVAIIALVPVALVLPGRVYDSAHVQSRYISCLRAYEGTRYVWGGKNCFGIDCSGLVRKALVNACFQEGFITANSALLRDAADMWWHDSSARSLREGYAGRTGPVQVCESLRSMPLDSLRPGDLAVTSDGVHVMAYLGQSHWIEADPTVDRVVILKPSDASPWLDRRMAVVRWHMLAVRGD